MGAVPYRDPALPLQPGAFGFDRITGVVGQ